MPEYRKKRVNRFKPAPRRKKKPIEAVEEDIKMSPKGAAKKPKNRKGKKRTKYRCAL